MGIEVMAEVEPEEDNEISLEDLVTFVNTLDKEGFITLMELSNIRANELADEEPCEPCTGTGFNGEEPCELCHGTGIAGYNEIAQEVENSIERSTAVIQ